MQYQRIEQIAAEADVLATTDLLTIPCLSRHARLERWAEMLARQPERLCAIPDVEVGPEQDREARRADGSPLSVAYADPVLRAAGLRGDTVGDAAEFFGLSHAELHHLVCFCHYGRTIAPLTAAAQVRALGRGVEMPALSATRLAAGVAAVVGLAVAAALV
jgi:hypothetical protein